MTDTPGWTPPVEPGPSPVAPGGWGTAPGTPQAYGSPGAPYGYGMPGSYAAHGAPEPGIVPLRPLVLGEILDGGFSIIRESPGVALGFSAIVVTITQLVNFGLLYLALDGGLGDPDAFGGLTVPRLLTWIVSGTGTLFLSGVMTAAMGEAILGRRATLGATWAKVRPRFWPLLAVSFLGTVLPMLALVFLIVPGVFLWGAWAFLSPAVVLERSTVGQSFRRSWRLAVPDWWRVWGIRSLAVLIAFVIQFVISVPFGIASLFNALNDPGYEIGVATLAIAAIGGTIGQTITSPFVGGVDALLYIDRRMRAEGLDVTLARAASPGAG